MLESDSWRIQSGFWDTGLATVIGMVSVVRSASTARAVTGSLFFACSVLLATAAWQTWLGVAVGTSIGIIGAVVGTSRVAQIGAKGIEWRHATWTRREPWGRIRGFEFIRPGSDPVGFHYGRIRVCVGSELSTARRYTLVLGFNDIEFDLCDAVEAIPHDEAIRLAANQSELPDSSIYIGRALSANG